MSTLGWISFVGLWVVQVIIVSFGMEMIRKYEAFAGPVILLTMLALAVWLFFEAGASIAFSTADSLSGGQMWWQIIVGGALWIAIYGTFVLNFCDFTRNATSRTAIIRGNFFGIPLNMLFFGAIVVVLAGAQYKINGQIIESPADIVATIPNTLLLVLACLALLVLTVAVNLMANFVAPIYVDQPHPAVPRLPPCRLGQRDHRPGDPAVEPLQLADDHRLLPWRPRRDPGAPLRGDHG